MTNDSKDFLIQKLNQNPLDSKKFISGVLTLACIMLVWLGTTACILFKTDTAPQSVSLATMVVPFLAAIGTALLTGQAIFEYKAMTSLQKADDNDKEEKIARLNGDNHETVTLPSNPLKPFSKPANADQAYD